MEKADDFKCVIIKQFIMCMYPNRSAPVRELLSNNSLFVGQLYEEWKPLNGYF